MILLNHMQYNFKLKSIYAINSQKNQNLTKNFSPISSFLIFEIRGFPQNSVRNNLISKIYLKYFLKEA